MLDLKYFEEAIKYEVWKEAMKEKNNVIKKKKI